MIQSITLQNFRSFGVKQTIPLEAMSVLVGPNDSGKSCFLSVGALCRRLCEEKAFNQNVLTWVGGVEGLVHRPIQGDKDLLIGWTNELGRYEISFRKTSDGELILLDEAIETAASESQSASFRSARKREDAFDRLIRLATSDTPRVRDSMQAAIVRPLCESREIRLFPEKIREVSPYFTETPRIGINGQNLAAVLSVWRSGFPERAEELDEVLSKSIPDLRHVLARPSPEEKGFQLWFQQTNGERFEAKYVSDGIVIFTALAMHAVEAEPGSVIFIEEPEHFLHPLRLHEIVELFRRVYTSKKCQFVIATHSPIFLNEFRDEPESILLFRRGPEGTLVTPLSERPKLVDALHTNTPGALLADGFFNDPLL